MSTARLARIATLIAPLAVTACTQHNPWFVLADDDRPGTTGADDSTTADPIDTTDTTDDAQTTDRATETEADPGTDAVITSTTDATTTSTTDAAETSTTDATTDASEPGTVELPATLATCALLTAGPAPHAGPSVCEAIADVQGEEATGLMLLDAAVSFNGGGERPAHVFLRFDVPAELGERPLVAATLTMLVDDSLAASGLYAGSVHASDPFDLASLEFAAPAQGAPLADSSDLPLTNSVVAWSLDPALLTPGAALHLRLAPQDDDGVLYLGGAAPLELRPRLTIDHL